MNENDYYDVCIYDNDERFHEYGHPAEDDDDDD